MPDSIPCPQCGAPAWITERFWLDSTDGPLEHLKRRVRRALVHHRHGRPVAAGLLLERHPAAAEPERVASGPAPAA
jgi:hypothetical protein